MIMRVNVSDSSHLLDLIVHRRAGHTPSLNMDSGPELCAPVEVGLSFLYSIYNATNCIFLTLFQFGMCHFKIRKFWDGRLGRELSGPWIGVSNRCNTHSQAHGTVSSGLAAHSLLL